MMPFPQMGCIGDIYDLYLPIRDYELVGLRYMSSLVTQKSLFEKKERNIWADFASQSLLRSHQKALFANLYVGVIDMCAQMSSRMHL
mmetsp:Transcript_33257/g.44126  ORF Transcript_33257/g.44126 Transcript_33257/m.44126 type:complete len:87 (+) Transcript_33257:408-668(+)